MYARILFLGANSLQYTNVCGMESINQSGNESVIKIIMLRLFYIRMEMEKREREGEG